MIRSLGFHSKPALGRKAVALTLLIGAVAAAPSALAGHSSGRDTPDPPANAAVAEVALQVDVQEAASGLDVQTRRTRPAAAVEVHPELARDGSIETLDPVAPPYTDLPMRAIGRVIAEDPKTHALELCTGTVVGGANESIVWTAGHCLHSGGRSGHWFGPAIFIPGFVPGEPIRAGDQPPTDATCTTQECPYGVWSELNSVVPAEWAEGRDKYSDVGALVLQTREGKTIQDAVGAVGIAFNADVTAHAVVTAFGYPDCLNPCGWDFDGTRQYKCVSPVTGRDLPVPWAHIIIHCDSMDSAEGGHSGGPWLLNGKIVSVFHGSYYWPVPSGVESFGPYLGAVARRTYRFAGQL